MMKLLVEVLKSSHLDKKYRRSDHQGVCFLSRHGLQEIGEVEKQLESFHGRYSSYLR